uniref:Elongation of very long chain fatty acids protein n=1 Tax=Ditylenchus dipsaci TaxID=166011 RepID=A0A915E7T1_9BILA
MLDSFNEFTIYRGNSTKTLHSEYVYRYSLPFESVGDKVWWTLLFQNYWQHSITISIVYYILIRVLQWFHADRKPFDLRQPLFLWNGALAVFSILGFFRFSEDLRTIGGTVDCPIPYAIPAIQIVKKPLIFLHYYHHAAVLVYTVHSGAEHTAPGQAFITMNYLAHSVMYTYYTITAYGKRPPKWVSMMVTSVQTTQMFAGVAVSAFVYKWKVYDNYRCQQSMANLYLAFVIYITFAVLFVQFFANAYLKNKKHAKSLEESSNKRFIFSLAQVDADCCNRRGASTECCGKGPCNVFCCNCQKQKTKLCNECCERGEMYYCGWTRPCCKWDPKHGKVCCLTKLESFLAILPGQSTLEDGLGQNTAAMLFQKVDTNGDQKLAKKRLKHIWSKQFCPMRAISPCNDRQTVDWIHQQNPEAAQTANLHILKWLNTFYKESIDKVPENRLVPAAAFLDALSDGVLLARLANGLSPGCVECIYIKNVHKKQVYKDANIEGFIDFAKNVAKLADGCVFLAEDLQNKYLDSYKAVFYTLYKLGIQAQQKFGKPGLNLELIAKDASTAFQKNLEETMKVKANQSEPVNIQSHKTGTFEIFLITTDGRRIMLFVHPNDSVQSLKAAAQEKIGYAPEEQRIIYAGNLWVETNSDTVNFR